MRVKLLLSLPFSKENYWVELIPLVLFNMLCMEVYKLSGAPKKTKKVKEVKREKLLPIKKEIREFNYRGKFLLLKTTQKIDYRALGMVKKWGQHEAKKKKYLTSRGFEPTTSGLDLLSLYRLSLTEPHASRTPGDEVLSYSSYMDQYVSLWTVWFSSSLVWNRA